MRIAIALVPLLLTLGCAGGEAPVLTYDGASHPGTFRAQVSRGQPLFEEHCAACHGTSGEGTAKAPRLVGLSQGALPLHPRPGQRLRRTEFRTAGDVAAFVMQNMPLRAPGSLPEEDYLDILAFALKANGIDLGERRLDPGVAAQLTIPR
jgi:cytochrome c